MTDIHRKKIKPSKIMLKILKTKISAIACQEMKKRMMKRKKTRLQILVLDKWSSDRRHGMGQNLSCMYLYESKFHSERIVVMYHSALNHIENQVKKIQLVKAKA